MTAHSRTMNRTYAFPPGGLPDQNELATGRAVFKTAYAVIPKGTMSDITASLVPGWTKSRFWVLARPLSGFAETFSQYAGEIESGGGSNSPECDPEAESVLFVTAGTAEISIDGESHSLSPGSYCYVAAGATWKLQNQVDDAFRFQWVRKHYVSIDGHAAPHSFVTHEDAVEDVPMPGTDGAWSTKRFVESNDLSHDMHVNIVSFKPGAHIPFAETHVMEHGLYVLEGRGVYMLNHDWVEVEAGDFMWLRAFCPQACYAGGPEPFRYLLYKDVNRHMPLVLGSRGNARMRSG